MLATFLTEKSCSKDSVSFKEPLGTTSSYCGSLQGFFAYETCSSEMDINYISSSTADSTHQGVSIYYESKHYLRSVEWNLLLTVDS